MGGNVIQDRTWPVESGGEYPYLIVSNVTVEPGATLTLDPGVVVKFEGGDDGLWVQGGLVAVGTVADSIVFTSVRDDVYGGDTDGDSGGPSKNSWSTICCSCLLSRQ